MLSQKAKYGLKALLYLADRPEGTLAPIGEIAEREAISRKFLDSILLDLKKRGYLASKMGKGGGYWLARSPAAIMVGDVIRALDGPLAPIPCASRTAFTPCADCADVAACRIRRLMLKARDAIAEVLDNTSLAEMSGRGEAAFSLKIYDI